MTDNQQSENKYNDTSYYPHRGLSGIVNLGNTCFMNAAIQCLSNTIPLTEYFLTEKYKTDLNEKAPEIQMLNNYYRVLVGMWEDNCVIRPIKFYAEMPKFFHLYKHGTQNDAQEFLNMMIDCLHNAISYKATFNIKTLTSPTEQEALVIKSKEAWVNTFKMQYSYMIDLFSGQYCNTLCCKFCNHSRVIFEAFGMFTLPVEENMTNIYDCVSRFSEGEILDDQNKWKCEKCGVLSNAQKKIKLWTLPKILIIHLKRFDMGGNKINTNIHFPLNGLDLGRWIDGYSQNNESYNLYAVCNHQGSPSSGHYNAYCKNKNGKWYLFNDHLVNKMSKKEVVSASAYILFYERNNIFS